jgi:hypothetical protein
MNIIHVHRIQIYVPNYPNSPHPNVTSHKSDRKIPHLRRPLVITTDTTM